MQVQLSYSQIMTVFVGNALILHFTFQSFHNYNQSTVKKFLKLDESVIDGLHVLLLRNFND